MAKKIIAVVDAYTGILNRESIGLVVDEFLNLTAAISNVKEMGGNRYFVLEANSDQGVDFGFSARLVSGNRTWGKAVFQTPGSKDFTAVECSDGMVEWN